MRVKRALLSVSDKAGLLEIAEALHAAGIELISTGGTKAALQDGGFAARDVSALTGFPEMLDGRVKTLHPGVHGGLLARRDVEAHRTAMAAHGLEEIELLYVNLYPFEATLAAGGDFEACLETIDIGGPAMLRAAAKNHAFVAAATDLDDMQQVLAEIAHLGGTSATLRRRLAAKVFARLAAYDAAIAGWMAQQTGAEDLPPWFAIGGQRVQALRYGENPHQKAALYRTTEQRPGAASAHQLQGKELSYNNLCDADAAFELAAELGFDGTAAIAIIKHANPCGAACAPDLLSAYRKALACDPVSAFGGIVAANRPLDEAAAAAISEIFTEVVIAPDADAAAKAIFARKKNLRLLLTGAAPDPRHPRLSVRLLAGGVIVQSVDDAMLGEDAIRVVTARAPTPSELVDLHFAWRLAKHVKSNAIVYARDCASIGIGAGQMSRIDSVRIGAWKALEAFPDQGARGAVAASDAFFPFADGIEALADAGVTAIFQPGGSIRDEEVIAAANRRGLAMAFTGLRHFRH